MEDFVRKLALWHTKTFKPIMTHEELEPIMATLGFVALPATSGWKEYVFYGWIPVPAENLPRIRLPFPRIDGLHVITYRAFFDAVSFYLAQRDISDHFHVRGMPLHRTQDLPFEKKFRRMNDEGLYLYRDGTLDPETALAYGNNNTSNGNNSGSSNNSSSDNDNNSGAFSYGMLGNGSANSSGKLGLFVPLKNIIV
ncbi:WD repeat-containing 62 [Cinnamomum micranthum f. kanehirae]|uniref:WD repeat-containing 62 n=1 Tax=Cinnamomum micranthum f. kanehirae TaxID=337451 RepID=A0A443NID0_9MAGN|nr:WD repeat-containing 62 [Cinnamomum micranthum f. kanehirae]